MVTEETQVRNTNEKMKNRVSQIWASLELHILVGTFLPGEQFETPSKLSTRAISSNTSTPKHKLGQKPSIHVKTHLQML